MVDNAIYKLARNAMFEASSCAELGGARVHYKLMSIAHYTLVIGALIVKHVLVCDLG